MSTPKRPSGNRPDQDSIYHRLFSHPVMVEQLVRDFVPEAMAVGLDFARMERVNAKFHSRRGKRREGDLLWRLPTLGGTDVLLHVLFEFQSTVDWWMATRAQVYTGLLWQHVVKEQKLGSGDRLPPVITVVLYNGDARWNAPRDTAGLVALPHDSPLWPWQPQARYYLLDEGAFPSDDLSRRETLAALLFRLEHCHLLDGLVDLEHRAPNPNRGGFPCRRICDSLFLGGGSWARAIRRTFGFGFAALLRMDCRVAPRHAVSASAPAPASVSHSGCRQPVRWLRRGRGDRLVRESWRLTPQPWSAG